jgi:poly(A) polymerase
MKETTLLGKLRRNKIVTTLSRFVKKYRYPAWLVGGYVRDTMLGFRSKDYDIALIGDEVKFSSKLAKELGGTHFCLDKKRSEYRIVLPRKITIDVKPITDITKDVQKRDFTINAIAVNLNTLDSLTDPFHGIDDAGRRILRPVHKKVFEEDPLRLLRMFRLASTLDLTISKEVISLAKKSSPKIETVASERIRQELILLLNSKNSSPYIKMMDDIDLLQYLFPEVDHGERIPQHKYRSRNLKEHSLVCYEIMEEIINEKKYQVFSEHISLIEKFVKKNSGMLKLAALLHDIGKLYTMRKDECGDVHFWTHEKQGEIRLKEFYKKRLSLSKKEVEILSTLILHHMRAHLLSKEKEVTNHALYRFVKDGGEMVPGILLLSFADSISSTGGGKEVRKAKGIITKILDYYAVSKKKKVKRRLITGDDLIKTFHLKPGPLFKTILEAVERAHIDGIVKKKYHALKYAEKLLEDIARNDKKTPQTD